MSARRFRWLRAASDRVPTKWFASIATALFLAATAAFGGLATAAAEGPVELDAGEEHRNDQLAITVQRAVLIDDLAEAGVTIEPGQRVLAVVVEVENRWTRALPTTPGNSVSSSVVLAEGPGLGREPGGVAHYDDSTALPWLQPGVPTTVVLAWAVDQSDYADGEELHLVLNDETLFTGSFVVSGQSWEDPEPAAIVTVRITDVGEGRDTETDADDEGTDG
ncbi:hypothetical protein [Agromyces ramosus]|uniref:hypothetical protein n=1 Tax=Agromyces ramosus TaxID=33879 RepID=UPI0027D85AD7|nr:hypothetical protein [Agromyces ramosus]